MKHATTLLLTLALSFSVAQGAEAKCFAFRGQNIKVCVDGNNNAARNQATSVCEDVTGDDCSISGYSGECRAGGNMTCYDENGDEQRHIESD